MNLKNKTVQLMNDPARKSSSNNIQGQSTKTKKLFFDNQNIRLKNSLKTQIIEELKINEFQSSRKDLSLDKSEFNSNNHILDTPVDGFFNHNQGFQDQNQISKKISLESIFEKDKSKKLSDIMIKEIDKKFNGNAPRKEKKKSLKNKNQNRKIERKPRIEDSLNDESDQDFEELSDNKSQFSLLPESNFKVIFDFMIAILVMIIVIISPLELAFENIGGNTLIMINVFIEAMFLWDVFINFFVAYYNDDDILIVNNYSIFKRYLLSNFLFDFISSIPGTIIIVVLNSKSMNFQNVNKLARMNRIFKISRFAKFLKVFYFRKSNIKVEYLERIHFSAGFIRVINFFYNFLMIVHIFSCAWIFIASFNDSNNWILNSKINYNSRISIYVGSVYFFLTTIFTVGYGDIVPSNYYERVLNILVMVVGLMIYSYSITSLGSLITTHDKITSKYLENIDMLEEIKMEYPKITELKNNFESSVPIYDKILRFFNYSQKNKKTYVLNFMDDLPDKLRNKFVLKIYQNFVKSFSLFKRLDKDQGFFISTFLLKMRPLKLSKSEFIYKKGEYIEELVIVKSGVLSAEIEDENYNPMNIYSLRKFDYYGLTNIFQNERSLYNLVVKSRTAEIFSVRKKDLIEICAEFPDIFPELFKNSVRLYLLQKNIFLKKVSEVNARIKSLSRNNFRTNSNNTLKNGNGKSFSENPANITFTNDKKKSPAIGQNSFKHEINKSADSYSNLNFNFFIENKNYIHHSNFYELKNENPKLKSSQSLQNLNKYSFNSTINSKNRNCTSQVEKTGSLKFIKFKDKNPKMSLDNLTNINDLSKKIQESFQKSQNIEKSPLFLKNELSNVVSNVISKRKKAFKGQIKRIDEILSKLLKFKNP